MHFQYGMLMVIGQQYVVQSVGIDLIDKEHKLALQHGKIYVQ